ncbi:MAG: hypothetical protein EOO50_15780 [Flavobacterium sp.]|uniref:hypothetical protein n=1 Tax=Flavobacterium sp. TaxID=239 RepID=UPI001215F99B|nr:hypothetical protein [Flavobacterium sp.]RZJ64414.1 MAG: hypothetical protein EOO50_15780 [Flavobacterium sp.]
MIKYYFTFIVILQVTLTANGQEKILSTKGNEKLTIRANKPDKIENGYYTNGELNWRIKILEGTTIDDADYWNNLSDKGYKEIKKTSPLINTNRSHLIGFKFNNQNSFTVSFNPMPENKITLKEHERSFLDVLNKSLSQIKGARFEQSQSNLKLGNFNFYRIKIEGYNAQNQLVLSQIYYNSIIGDKLFSSLITYNESEKGKSMEDNFISSWN